MGVIHAYMFSMNCKSSHCVTCCLFCRLCLLEREDLISKETLPLITSGFCPDHVLVWIIILLSTHAYSVACNVCSSIYHCEIGMHRLVHCKIMWSPFAKDISKVTKESQNLHVGVADFTLSFTITLVCSIINMYVMNLVWSLQSIVNLEVDHNRDFGVPQ